MAGSIFKPFWMPARHACASILVLLVLLFASHAQAQFTATNIDLGVLSDHFLDRSGAETAESLSKPDGQARFQQSNGTAPNYGVRPTRNAALWLRVRVPELQGPSEARWVISLNEPRTRVLTVFIPEGDSFRAIKWTAGAYDHDAFSVSRYPDIRVPGSSVSGRTIFVKVETASSMRGLLWISSERHFAWSYGRSAHLLGWMSGALCALAIFLLANGLFARDRSALALGGVMASYLVYFIAHHAVLDTFLVPGSIAWSRVLSLTATFAIFSFSLLFAYHALQFGKNFPRLRILALALIALLFGLSLLTAADILLDWFIVRKYSSQIGMASRLLTIAAALATMFKDWRRATLFLFCWLPSIVGANLRMIHDVWPSLGTSEIWLNSAFILSMTSLTLFAIFASLDMHWREQTLTATIAAQAERNRGLAEQEKLAAIGQMAGRIAHEVNNLLHPIMNHARRAADGTMDEKEKRQSLALVSDAANRAREVVASLLASVRPSSEPGRRLPIGIAIRESVETIKGLVPYPIRFIASDIEPGGPDVFFTDAFRVLVNLVANSVHAMTGGGEITLTACHQAGRYCFTIRDTGKGMDEATMTHSTEAYFTTRASEGGTGLGLTIVRDIAAQWQAELSIESLRASGTIITITFPK